nr:NAD dependent epimerase/dehydratase (TERH) [Polytomella parva]|eukprot:CAMPEP_0175059596 /NCGR_PEP_ID=MMETSP0052_2-20121109/12518_1 /TAXON_ID=51329 ORGANISM="Polytomella parva, Strain SAG 63-3" /NCGR_SAMPLE_ID=MMETSP0052_2 /ASSEMBLY_ACC=CAM_ASM_000194 /LENGTH=274 /DNA_ID=CAMNT_0016325159 /DNA_START=103 /DNA_END=927 /DNA_ORIENTATION=+
MATNSSTLKIDESSEKPCLDAIPMSTDTTLPPPPPPARTTLLVLGGRGFLGSRVCHEALSTGLHVVGLSRSGTPPFSKEPWVSQVEWARGDALDPESYSSFLRNSAAVISCVGGFGSNEQMWKTNGTSNVTAIEAASAAGVPRFVYVSAFIPFVPGLSFALEGYVKGKQQAERALRRVFPYSGVVLRPGAIYGDRSLSENVSLPLQCFFKPAEKVVGLIPAEIARKVAGALPFAGAVAVPPLAAETVARVAVRAATDESFPVGILDPWDIRKHQ